MTTYRQCILEKGNVSTTSWIPSKFAIKGKFIKLKDNGKWVNGWEVIEVGTEMAEKTVIERSRDYLKQREASDI